MVFVVLMIISSYCTFSDILDTPEAHEIFRKYDEMIELLQK